MTWDTRIPRKSSSATIVVHLGHPPAPECGERRTREPSSPPRSGVQTPQRQRSTHAHDRSQERRHTCRIVRFRSDLRLPHAALATPQAAFARLVALFHFAPVVAPAPRGCTDNGSDNARSTHNAARTRVTTTRTAHRCRVRHAELLHPPLRRHHRRTPVAASAVSGLSRRVRAVRGPFGYWAMGVEPLRPERCTTMSVRRYSVDSASRASRVHAPYVRVSRAPAPGWLSAVEA